jgi:hypothetical protein
MVSPVSTPVYVAVSKTSFALAETGAARKARFAAKAAASMCIDFIGGSPRIGDGAA